jgi:hypothetical protein
MQAKLMRVQRLNSNFIHSGGFSPYSIRILRGTISTKQLANQPTMKAAVDAADTKIQPVDCTA